MVVVPKLDDPKNKAQLPFHLLLLCNMIKKNSIKNDFFYIQCLGLLAVAVAPLIKLYYDLYFRNPTEIYIFLIRLLYLVDRDDNKWEQMNIEWLLCHTSKWGEKGN